MELELLTYTPELETLVAVAMLTTSSGKLPSILFKQLKEKPEKTKEVVDRLELQHGSILEHNRLVWQLKEEDSKVLDILLNCKYFNITRINSGTWILSANIRTVIEYVRSNVGDLSQALVESIKDVAPTIFELVGEAKE